MIGRVALAMLDRKQLTQLHLHDAILSLSSIPSLLHRQPRRLEIAKMREVLLPVEIMSLIADECPVRALKNSALVSSRWTITAQARLFRSVHWPDCHEWTREVEIVRKLRPPSHSTLVADLRIFRDIIGKSKHLRSMVSELYLADTGYRSREVEGAWQEDVRLVISMLVAPGQLRQLELDSDLLDPQVPLKQYGVTSLIHAPDYRSVRDAIDYEDLVRFACLPTLQTLELEHMARFHSGVRPEYRLQNFSNITTFILHDVCLGGDLRYVFAWFKSLQVLEITSFNWDLGTAYVREPLHADQIPQWLMKQRTSLKKLAIQTDEVTISVTQPFGTDLREFVVLEHLVCSIEVLTEGLSAGWQPDTCRADEAPTPEIPRFRPEEILPPQLRTLEILLSNSL